MIKMKKKVREMKLEKRKELKSKTFVRGN